MIWESWPWKQRLLSDARSLKRLVGKHLSEKEEITFERIVHVSAYTVRKLFESKKLTSALEARYVSCEKIPRLKSRITELNAHRLEEHYNYDQSSCSQINAKALCNQLIHSYHFIIYKEENGGLRGFAVASDRDKEKVLYLVNIADYIEFILEVGRDKVKRITYNSDPVTGKETIMRE